VSEAEQAVRVDEVDDLAALREPWLRLAPLAGHPFATYEWNSIWWRHFGGGRPLYTFACRDRSGEVAAILPMYLAARQPFGVARLLGYADLQSPVCAPEHRPLAAEAIRRVTRRPYPCRVLFAERLPIDDGWAPLLGGSELQAHPGPILRFGGESWEDLLRASLSRKNRSNLGRKERRLLDTHGLVYRLADDPARLEDDMRALFRLHGQRWGAETTGIFDGAGAEFHLELAAAAQKAGWLRLWIAEIEGEPAAAWYGFRFAGVQWHLQGGRDPRFDRLSVGKALWLHSIRDAHEGGMSAYHFLAGDEAYKMHFANGDSGAESRVVGAPLVAPVVAGAVRARMRLATRSARRDQPPPEPTS
jgi:CelD/BcsL family acetyltransferase involved in cellulose biosynthesis